MNSTLSIILIIMGIITLYLSFWSFISKKGIDGYMEFALFMLSVAIYTFGYALEISYSELSKVLIAIKFEYISIPYMALLAFLLTYRYINKKPLKSSLIILLSIIPLTSTILVFTLEHHNLFYINPQIIDGDYFPVLIFKKGSIYILRFIYQQVLVIISITYALYKMRHTYNYEKKHYIFLILAQLIPGLIAFLYIVGLNPNGIDINPFSSFIVGTIFAIAILKYGFFELIPIGRNIVLDSINDAFIIIDNTYTVIDFNNAASKLEFYKPELNNKINNSDNFSVLLKDAIDDGLDSFNYSFKNISNCSLHYKISICDLSISQKNQIGKVVIITDITDVMALLEKLKLQASVDYLTGVSNRRELISNSIREIEISKRTKLPLTFIMVDIDNFKMINDEYGHITGDQVLINVSKALSQELRNIDLIGRYGGEEFLIICPNTNKVDGINTAERLRQKLLQLKPRVTCSFGVYTHSDFISDIKIDTLIDFADKALYNAKNLGKNRVCY
ncbi:MAG: diguanylate cyclase [Spirochaetales bacterium]|nr:diguanylate cyclase [Spirochaetales bacterium]